MTESDIDNKRRLGAAGGGSGILLQDRGALFEGASKREARRKRDAAIPDPSAFDDDPRLCVTLRWRRKERWQARRGGQWVDICVGEADEDED